MRVTLAQIAPKLNRSNLDNIVKIIQEHKDESDLIVFPELALSGYSLQDKLFEDAWDVDELSVLEDLSLHVDIVVGAAIRDKKLFRNQALYFHHGKLLSQHNKVHLPNYGMFEEARYFEDGDSFDRFKVLEKQISMVICEDLWHREAHDALLELNPDIIIVLVASPARGFNDDGLAIEKSWYEIIQSIAKESSSQLLFVNRVGFEDGLGFWGGSCIVDQHGEIIKRLAQFEEEIVTFNIEG